MSVIDFRREGRAICGGRISREEPKALTETIKALRYLYHRHNGAGAFRALAPLILDAAARGKARDRQPSGA